MKSEKLESHIISLELSLEINTNEYKLKMRNPSATITNIAIQCGNVNVYV